jgi:penicillin-binding protein 1A
VVSIRAPRPSPCRWRAIFPRAEKTVKRKLTEALLAYRIESALNKDQILELYMNQIYLGKRTHGFASAARTYFNKRLQDLSLAEAAMLAGIPQNPPSIIRRSIRYAPRLVR